MWIVKHLAIVGGRGILLAAIGCLALAEQPSVIEPEIDKGTNTQLAIEYKMRLLKDSTDQGVYAILFSIKNLADRDFDFVIYGKESSAFTVMIYDAKGEELSKDKFPITTHTDTPDTPSIKKVTIPSGITQEWFLPLNEYIKAGGLPIERLEACKIFLAKTHGTNSFGLYNTNVVLTRKALEGDMREKYKNSLHRDEASGSK